MATLPQELPRRQMNGPEALMWALDDDPALRSSFMGITFLDRPPDPARLRARIEAALGANPVLLERVAQSSFDLAPPHWEPDPGFDLDFHMRHVALPPPGTRRQLLDLAALLYADPWDKTKPLWQFTVVEGLEDGGAALLSKMHHVISDGIGAIRLSVSFLDLAPDGAPMPVPPRPAKAESSKSWFDAAAGALGPLLGLLNVVRSPSRGVSTVRSLVRQLGVTDPARSPLWNSRSYAHRFDTLSWDLEETRDAAKRLGGTINDAYVTMLAGAVGAYHRALGEPVDELRMAMPISVRRSSELDKEVGGNAWVPSRLLVPTGDMAVADRFADVHSRLSGVRNEPGLGLTDTFAGIARLLPSPVLVRFARQQTGTVDFACSNVRGAPFDLWISGGAVLANPPMGPTAGAAFNATVMSYKGSMDLGLSTDTGAIADPDLLVQCIQDGVAEVLHS